MCSVSAKLADKASPEKKIELTKEVAMRLSNAKIDPGEVARTIRYLHWGGDIKNAREVLRRFSRDRTHFGRSLSMKRQHAAIEREFFTILSVCSDVNELIVLGTQIVRLMPYYAQGSL